MNVPHSDALVFFGATWRSRLQENLSVVASDVEAREPECADHRRGQIRLESRPITGAPVTASRNTAELILRRLTSYAAYCVMLTGTTRSGNFHSIRKELGPARRPAYYLAIPPTLFQLVVEQLAKSGCTKGPALFSKSHLAETSPRRAI